MADEAALLGVVETLYDSVIDESKWPVALQSIAEFTSGHGAFHIVTDPRSGTIARSISVGIDCRLLLPYDIPYVMATWLTKSTAAFEILVIEGSRTHGAFDQEAIDTYSHIVPHLRLLWGTWQTRK